MFVGWEGVGLCSYLLIGFWYQKKSAADAGKKAFIVNRIGDFGFILGVLLLFVRFGTLDFQERRASGRGAARRDDVRHACRVITLLLFVGATGKSAQIPLYVWLPDAMEGPTPVSALIHAATMVTAGVYMIGRNAVLFSHAPRDAARSSRSSARRRRCWPARSAWCRTTSSACSRIRPSRSSATCSWRWASARSAPASSISTRTRSSRRCCSSARGAVIHALHGEQDLRQDGRPEEGPADHLLDVPDRRVAIAGVPGLAGFFSKDEILCQHVRDAATRCCGSIGLLTSLLTATYMFRLVFLAFHGAALRGCWRAWT